MHAAPHALFVLALSCGTVFAQSPTSDVPSSVLTLTPPSTYVLPDDIIKNAQGQTATVRFPVETLQPTFNRDISGTVKMTTQCDGGIGFELNLRPFPVLPDGQRFRYYLAPGPLLNGDCLATGPPIRHGDLSTMHGSIPSLSNPYAATFVTNLLSFNEADSAVFIGTTLFVIANPDGVPITCAPVEVLTPFVPFKANETQSLCVSALATTRTSTSARTGSTSARTGTDRGSIARTDTTRSTGASSGDFGFGNNNGAGVQSQASSAETPFAALSLVLRAWMGVAMLVAALV